MNITANVIISFFRGCFALEQSPYFDPIWAVLDITVTRRDDDVQRSTQSPQSNSDGRTTSSGVYVVLIAVVVLRAVELLLRRGGDASDSGSRLLDRYLAADSDSIDMMTQQQRRADDNHIPRAPIAGVGSGCIVPPADKSLCPICLKKRESPSASTGGYVFCHSCLVTSVRKTPVCPVTGFYCGEQDIIPLLLTS